MTMRPDVHGPPSHIPRGGQARSNVYLQEVDFTALRSPPPITDPMTGTHRPMNVSIVDASLNAAPPGSAPPAALNELPYSKARVHAERYTFASAAHRADAHRRHEARYKPLAPNITEATVTLNSPVAPSSSLPPPTSTTTSQGQPWNREDARLNHTQTLQKFCPRYATDVSATRNIPFAGTFGSRKETVKAAFQSNTASRVLGIGSDSSSISSHPTRSRASRSHSLTDTACRVLGSSISSESITAPTHRVKQRVYITNDMPAAGLKPDTRIPLIDPVGGRRYGVPRFTGSVGQ